MEGNSEAAIKNKLVEQYIKVLTTTEYTNQLKVSIDNATDTVKGVLKQIESKKKVEHQEPMWVYTPQYQEMVKDEYTKGKSGIGPFALNNAHHILTQLMKIQYVSNDFTQALNLIDLGKQYDDDGSGKRILDWLSAMINAFVDIAKDPYIVRLNVNPYTFNMTAYLLRMGKGEQTFYFLKQPVIDEVAKAVLNTRGNYGKDTTKTQSEIEQEATNKVLEKYGITQDVLDAQRDILKDPRLLATHLAGLFDGELKNMLLGNDITDEQRKKYQAKVWLAWQALTPYAKDMADLVKYSKIDTKKMGKSFAAQRIFEKGMEDMRNPLNNRFASGEVSRFFDNTFLSKKAQNSINFGRSLFENQLLRTSPKFLDCLDNILYRLGKTNSVDERLLRTIVGSMEAAIKSEFFNQKMIENKVNVYDLMYGENSIAKRLMKLRNRINHNQIADLHMTSMGFNNELLNFLMPNNLKFETTFQEPDYVNVKTMFDQDVHTKNMIISAWEELLDHSDKEVSKLAEDLIYYAFITSGDNKNMNAFFEFVPTSWRNEYSEFLQNKLDNNETVVDYRDVMLNNWTNNDIVPRVEHTYVEQKITADGIMNEETSLFGIRSKMKAVGSSINPYLSFSGKAGNKNRIKSIGTKVIEEFDVVAGILKKNRYPIYPSFVKIKYGSTNSPSSYLVYELVGYNREVSKTTQQPVYTPIYMLVNKKGMRYKGHVITEYGRTDNYSFNFFPSGISKQDFMNDVIKDVILKSPRIPEKAKGSFNYTFVSQFEDINTLPSYMNDNEMDRANEEAMRDTFGDYGERVELNDEPPVQQNDPSEFINHSGGADGSDTVWGQIGEEYGVKSNHYYHGERTQFNAPLGNTEITEQDYNEGRYKVALAAKRNWGYQYSSMKDDRLVRNWAQVKYADLIFAIGTIVQPGERVFPNQKNDTRVATNPTVTGGTGYAVGMAINEGKPVHVFDQTKDSWYTWNGEEFIQEETPVLTKNFAGIGTREINDAGKQAIRDVYGKTFESEEYKDKEGEKIKKQCKGE